MFIKEHSVSKKIIYITKFSKDLALAVDDFCYYFKAKKKPRSNYAKSMLPLHFGLNIK